MKTIVIVIGTVNVLLWVVLVIQVRRLHLLHEFYMRLVADVNARLIGEKPDEDDE